MFQGLGVACGPHLVLRNNNPMVTDRSLDHSAVAIIETEFAHRAHGEH